MYILRGKLFFALVAVVAALLGVWTVYQSYIDSSPLGTDGREVRLYFSNREGTQVVGENRALAGTITAEKIVRELIKGPEAPHLYPTLPPSTRLLSLLVQGRIAYVDFSREVQDNFLGGTAAELMLVYSVIASLTEMPDIASVQFLLEGQVKESIWGHIDTSVPLTPDAQFIAR